MANSVDPDQTAPRSSLFWVHAVCFYTQFVSNVRQLFAEDDFSRRHFQMHFFLGAVRVNERRWNSRLSHIRDAICRDNPKSAYAISSFPPTGYQPAVMITGSNVF